MITPTDTLVGPVVDGLIGVTGQISGIGRTYREPPEGAPEDNSVIFPLTGFEVKDDTNGRLFVALTFEISHLFRRGRLNETVGRIIPFVPAWLDRLTAWPNQSLGGAAEEVSVKSGKIAGFTWASQQYLALSLTVTVLTELPISTV